MSSLTHGAVAPYVEQTRAYRMKSGFPEGENVSRMVHYQLLMV